MKIGYLRFNQYVELEYGVASMLGSDIRLGILSSMVKQGHEVEVLSPVKPNQAHMTDGKRDGKYDFLNKVVFDSMKDPDKYDAIFIEYASLNTTFSYINAPLHLGFDGRPPYLSRTFDILNKYRGKVFYFQNDMLPFPYVHAHRAKVETANSERHVFSLMQKHPILEDKEYTILTTAQNVEAHREREKNSYNHPGLKMKSIKLGRGPFHEFHGENRQVTDDLVYVGSNFDPWRRDRFRDLYSIPGVSSAQYGAEAALPGDRSIAYKGELKQDQVIPTIGTGLASVQIVKKPFAEVGMMTQRAVEIVQSGAQLLVDRKIQGCTAYVDSKQCVRGSIEVKEAVDRLKSLSETERNTLARKQFDAYPEWGPWNEVLN